MNQADLDMDLETFRREYAVSGEVEYDQPSDRCLNV